MAELDITLTIYSDGARNKQVARFALYAGSALHYDIWKCWHWATDNGFIVYNPSVYDPRFEGDYKKAGTDIPKQKIVSWLNDDLLSTGIRQKVDGTNLLEEYPDSFVFNLKFVDWS